jgi:hypothetical protein
MNVEGDLTESELRTLIAGQASAIETGAMHDDSVIALSEYASRLSHWLVMLGNKESTRKSQEDARRRSHPLYTNQMANTSWFA